MRVRRWSVRRTWAPALPGLIVTLPLVGFSFQGDERRAIYWAVRLFGSSPLRAARHAYDNIGVFLDFGNFRPIGRFLENVEHAFVFEAAETTSLAPHVVHGGIRLIMIAVLAIVATQMVRAVMRSAGDALPRPPALVLYPLALATTLVASDAKSPITLFPFLFIGSVAFVLLAALVVARDIDMQVRPLSWHEPVSMALLGAVAAMTFDLVYVAPPLSAAFIAVRAVAAGWSLRHVLRTAALRRWTALSIGFLAVFVPTRIVIADHCRRLACYSGSDIDLSGDVVDLTAGRILTGAPPAGWSNNAELARESGLEFGVSDLAANSLLALLLAAIAVVTVRAAIRATHRTVTADDSPVDWPRLAVGLGALGAVTAALPALLVSLSKLIQRERPPIGEAWRDTLLAQVGWSFVISAIIVAVAGAVGSRRMARITVAGLAAALGIGLTMTLLANARLAQVDRGTPLSTITSQISTATINIDPTDGGNTRRCKMIDAYTEILPDPAKWIHGPQLRVELNQLMLGRYGWPFCDPGRTADDDSP